MYHTKRLSHHAVVVVGSLLLFDLLGFEFYEKNRWNWGSCFMICQEVSCQTRTREERLQKERKQIEAACQRSKNKNNTQKNRKSANVDEAFVKNNVHPCTYKIVL